MAWGDAISEAFEPASRRLALTGTPFRSDTSQIPFVTYAPDAEGIRRSQADYTYGYGAALADGVVRPVIFMSYAGQLRWRTKSGDEIAASLGEPMTKDAISQAWRTALDPAGNWIGSVLRAADKRLDEVRRAVPDAGGLVIATDHDAARAYAKILRELTGRAPTVVLSDDPKASKRIDDFAESDKKWLVAVRMVSEGVDVPRLAVGVYATSISTPLFFAQAVGRFVRARRRGETASVFLPSVPSLVQFAHELELERDHVLDRRKRGEDDLWSEEEDILAEANTTKDEKLSEEFSFKALESEASFDRVLFDGGEYGLAAEPGSAAEADYLGIPGLLEPEHVRTLLQKRQTRQIARQRGAKSGPEETVALPAEERPVVSHQQLLGLRKELHTLVGAWHHQSGLPHGVIHNDLRRSCGGPPAAQATAAELKARIEKVRAWATGREKQR
jgi:superfamily II DNA or RNA helicase